MGKFDEIRRVSGGAIGESFGAGRAAGATPPGLDLARSVTVPARLQGTVKAKDALVIPVDKLQRDDDQPREDFDDAALDRLAESLKARGQLQPIRVRWDEGRGAYVIIAGERRWRAAVRAGLPTLTCMVHEGPLAPEELLAIQLVENALREDLKPVEQARAYRRLMEAHGWSGNQLARELAVAPSSVSRALALLDLPSDVQRRVDAGELPARAAAEIGRLADPAEQVALAERAVAEGLTRDQVMETVKARRVGKAAATPGGKREIKFDDGARIVVTLPPGSNADTAAFAEMLRRGLKKLQAELKQAGPGHAA
jgi:ParB family chromosome partitioning protein